MSDWISVNDGLPDYDERVLICDGENIGHARRKDGLYDYHWSVVASNSYVPSSQVTHWMPLPALPA